MVLSTSTTSTLSSTLSPGEGSLLGLRGFNTQGLKILAPLFVVMRTSKSFISFGVGSFNTFTVSTFPLGSVQEIVALNCPLPEAITLVEKVVVVAVNTFSNIKCSLLALLLLATEAEITDAAFSTFNNPNPNL